MRNLHARVKILLLKIRINFLYLRITIQVVRKDIAIKRITIISQLKTILVTVIAFMEIAKDVLAKILPAQLREFSNYITSIIAACLGLTIIFLSDGTISLVKFVVFFCCAFFGSLITPITYSFLGVLYLMTGKFQKDRTINELTSTQKTVFVFITESFDDYEKSRLMKSSHLGNKFSSITEILFGTKNQKEIFDPIVCDWQGEYFEALFKEEIWKARIINVRYTYAFLVAMWQKSPLGDLIEFIRKIAK